MADYKLSNVAKSDLIRIHQYGVEKFDSIFECFDRIAKNPFSFESVDDIKTGYRRCVCGSDTIYFKITNNRVAVMAIIGKQDLKNIL